LIINNYNFLAVINSELLSVANGQTNDHIDYRFQAMLFFRKGRISGAALGVQLPGCLITISTGAGGTAIAIHASAVWVFTFYVSDILSALAFNFHDIFFK